LSYEAPQKPVTAAEWLAHARNAEREAQKLATMDGKPDTVNPDSQCPYCVTRCREADAEHARRCRYGIQREQEATLG
jgi:hypothetical protein